MEKLAHLGFQVFRVSKGGLQRFFFLLDPSDFKDAEIGKIDDEQGDRSGKVVKTEQEIISFSRYDGKNIDGSLLEGHSIGGNCSQLGAVNKDERRACRGGRVNKAEAVAVRKKMILQQI